MNRLACKQKDHCLSAESINSASHIPEFLKDHIDNFCLFH